MRCPQWLPMYDGIKGFNPELGVNYTVRARKDSTEMPPAEALDMTYTLLKVLHSTQTQ